MNSDAVRTFIEVSEERSFTKASRKLYMAQSTITNRIKELEKELGEKLFQRKDKNVELTQAGIIFSEYAYKYVELEKKLKSDIYNSNKFADTLNIGSVKGIYESHLRKHLQYFVNNNKDVSVHLINEHSRMVLNRLADNLIDIGFSYIPIVEQGYICKLFREDEILFVSRARSLVHKEEVSKEELPGLPVIYSKFVKTPGFDFMGDLFPTYHRFCMNISIMSEIIPFLLNGTYYAFLPYGLIKEHLDKGLLKPIRIKDYDIPPLKSYAIIKSEKHLNTLDFFLKELPGE